MTQLSVYNFYVSSTSRPMDILYNISKIIVVIIFPMIDVFHKTYNIVKNRESQTRHIWWNGKSEKFDAIEDSIFRRAPCGTVTMQ